MMNSPAPNSPPSPPATGAPPAAPTCPKCGAPIGPSNKFCPACGQALSPTSAAPAGTPVDIRQRVDDDRGVLKKLQLLVPGFRGYRQGEDLREADSVLRLQVADKVHATISLLTTRRQALSTAGRFDSLNDLALSIADLTRLEGEIRHAEQGYTGISPALRVTVQGQDQLYEFDYGFALAGNSLLQTASALPDPSLDAATVKASTDQLRQMVARLEQAFRARIRTIQQVQIS